jgi:hypothetical protein
MVIICLAAVGCGNAVVERTGGDQSGAALLKLGQYYSQASVKLKRPPKSVQEFRQQHRDKADIEDTLKSPNDGEPHVVVWGTDPVVPRGSRPEGPVVFAYEKKGAGGVRWVLTNTGVSKLTDDEFRAANFPAGHSPGS